MGNLKIGMLLDVGEGVVDCFGLGLALMLFEIRLKLLFRLGGVQQEFLPRAECQATDVAIRGAGSVPDEPYDLEIAIGHGNIITETSTTKCGASERRLSREYTRKNANLKINF